MKGKVRRIFLLAFLSMLFASLASAQSLGDAARKAREQKRQEGRKATHVFTNDNLPTTGAPVSVVGTPPPPPKEKGEEATAEGEAAAKPEEKKETRGEAYWRAKFAEQRTKIATAEKELDILQRELNLKQQQYYSDPSEAMRQQFSRSEINTQTQKINDKREEINKLKAEVADLEDQLRKDGGDPSWAR